MLLGPNTRQCGESTKPPKMNSSPSPSSGTKSEDCLRDHRHLFLHELRWGRDVFTLFEQHSSRCGGDYQLALKIVFLSSACVGIIQTNDRVGAFTSASSQRSRADKNLPPPPLTRSCRSARRRWVAFRQLGTVVATCSARASLTRPCMSRATSDLPSRKLHRRVGAQL